MQINSDLKKFVDIFINLFSQKMLKSPAKTKIMTKLSVLSSILWMKGSFMTGSAAQTVPVVTVNGLVCPNQPKSAYDGALFPEPHHSVPGTMKPRFTRRRALTSDPPSSPLTLRGGLLPERGASRGAHSSLSSRESSCGSGRAEKSCGRCRHRDRKLWTTAASSLQAQASSARCADHALWYRRRAGGAARGALRRKV